MSIIPTGLEKLKIDYEQIHAPQELEERLLKMEKEYTEKKYPRNFIVWSRRVAACLCCAIIGIGAASNINASAAEALQKIPVIGAISKVVTFRDYHSGDADIKTPHITGLGDKNVEKELNQKFDKYADELIAQYESDVKGMENGGHEAVTSTYQVLVDNDSQLTIEMNTVLIRGDSMESRRYYNINKNTGKLLKLADLFQSGADYAAPINAYIMAEIQKTPDDYFTDEDAFRSIAADQNFYVDPNGKLVVVFDEASIAAAYKGVIKFTVPTDKISNILADHSLIH